MSDDEARDDQPAKQGKKKKKKKEQPPIRWLWVVIGAVVMGGIAMGVAWAAMQYGLMFRLGITDPQLAFLAFQAMCGVGYLVGGFLVALLSPGETLTEPLIGAVAAFLVQTAILIAMEWLTLNPKGFLTFGAIAGGMAYAGAWLGEKLTGH